MGGIKKIGRKGHWSRRKWHRKEIKEGDGESCDLGRLLGVLIKYVS